MRNICISSTAVSECRPTQRHGKRRMKKQKNIFNCKWVRQTFTQAKKIFLESFIFSSALRPFRNWRTINVAHQTWFANINRADTEVRTEDSQYAVKWISISTHRRLVGERIARCHDVSRFRIATEHEHLIEIDNHFSECWRIAWLQISGMRTRTMQVNVRWTRKRYSGAMTLFDRFASTLCRPMLCVVPLPPSFSFSKRNECSCCTIRSPVWELTKHKVLVLPSLAMWSWLENYSRFNRETQAHRLTHTPIGIGNSWNIFCR